MDYEPSTYGVYKFPTWADGLGWFLAVMMVISIPIVVLYRIGHADSYLTLREVSQTHFKCPLLCGNMLPKIF